jgi:sec-independent protein translocase protein TatB
MFDIGFPELFIIAVLAIIFVGPKDLPKVIRSGMSMLRKVREMGREFQDGVKKMADEVELDAVTRKLNEAGNISLDDVGKKKKPETDTSTDFSDYEEFDYDAYDYENGGSSAPAKPDIKPDDDKVADEKPDVDEAEAAKATTEVEPEAPVEVATSDGPPKPSAKKGKKSKSSEDE